MLSLRKSIYLFLFVSLQFVRISDLSAKDKIIYEYKDYEKIDLGSIEVKGKIIAPGDVSVKSLDRAKLSREIYIKENFDKETRHDISSFK